MVANMNQPTNSTGSILLKSIKYFGKLAQVSETFNTVLKSHYLNKQGICEEKIVSECHESRPKAPVKCSHCNLYFAETLAQHYVKPGISKTKFLNKLLKKQREGKILTKYQSLYLKKVDAYKNNTMMIVCGFCNYKNSIPLSKPVDLKPDQRRQEHLNITPLSTESNSGNKKKKKKRKDKYCGLNQNIVSTISEKKSTQTDLIPLEKQKHVPIKHNKQNDKYSNERLSSNKHKQRQTNKNKNAMNMNSQQITRNLNISKIKNAKSKKTFKTKISNMLNINNESTNASTLQNLFKSL